MAKKTTTKKSTTKKTTKKVTKVVEEAPIEVQDFEVAVTEEVEVMNGDPTVIVSVEEPEPTPEPIEEPTTEEPMILNEEESSVAPIEEPVVEGVETKEIKKKFKSVFGYLWNGQEMDY